VGSPPGGAGPPLAAPPCGEATLAHYCHRPVAYIVIPENLSQGGIRDRHRRLCGAENTEREKLSGRQKFAGEIPSWRGEIIAIAIIIALDFTGSSSPSPSSSSSPSSPPSPCHPDVTYWVESCQILRGNFPGVDYLCS
jgi:hypothetical protein